MKKSIYKLDPESDKYRVCPECKTPFMADHRSMLYCSDKHRNEFHNRTKRESNKGNRNQMMKILSNAKEAELLEQLQSASETNIQILSQLSIDPEKGSTYYFSDLIGKNFKWPAYTFKYALPNTDEKSFCLEYGPFKTFRTAPDKLLIYKTPQNDNLSRNSTPLWNTFESFTKTDPTI